MLESSAVQNSFSNKSLLWSAAETLESTTLESAMLKDGLQLEQTARRALSSVTAVHSNCMASRA